MHRRSRRILLIIGGIALACGVLYAVALVRSTVKLRRAYAALAADGRPLRTDEIVPPQVPDVQNAALLYQSAALMLKGQTVDEKNLLERLGELSGALLDQPDNPDRIARQQRSIAELRHLMTLPVVASALDALAQGTQRPACRFDRQ